VKSDPNIIIDVNEGVYAPSDDTYLMLRSVEITENDRVLEVGTGSGIIALHCANVGAFVTAADISRCAVRNARMNAVNNGVDLNVIRTDLASGLCGMFDVIIFNPPYLITDEGAPDNRVIGGEGGWELSVRFLDVADGILSEGGRIYLLTSSLSSEEVLAHAEALYSVERVGAKDLFFERLEVLKLAKPR
jgi:release factor glutamine methyltransferase